MDPPPRRVPLVSMWVLLLFTSDLACENVYLLLTPLTPYSLGFSPSCRILLLLPPHIPLCWAPSPLYCGCFWASSSWTMREYPQSSVLIGAPNPGPHSCARCLFTKRASSRAKETGSDAHPPIHFSLRCLNPLQDQGFSCPDFSSTLGTTGTGNDQKTQKWQISQHPKTLPTVAYQLPTFQNHI